MIFKSADKQCSYCGVTRPISELEDDCGIEPEVFVAHTGLVCARWDQDACIDRHDTVWQEKTLAPIV